MPDWIFLTIQYNGINHQMHAEQWQADEHRLINDAYWTTILDLPNLVVVEWAHPTQNPNYNQYLIYIHQTLTSAA